MATKPQRMSAQEKQWRAQDDVRTLTAAEGIRNDPKRMSEVRKHASNQMTTLAKVAGKTAPKK